VDDGVTPEGEVPPPPSSGDMSFAEVFRDIYPYYMHIGMSYEEFWHGDPYLCVYYRAKHDLDNEEANQQMWWNGLYVFTAISTALSNVHLDGKHHKINQYISEPFKIRPLTEEEKAAETERAKAVVVEQLNAIKDAWDARQEAENAG